LELELHVKAEATVGERAPHVILRVASPTSLRLIHEQAKPRILKKGASDHRHGS